MTRKKISKMVEAQVLMASRRRCCLCLFYLSLDQPRPGQIAHLDRDASNSKFENLVYLCLEHHDAYDSRTSQSKGFSEIEVRHLRDELYKKFPKSEIKDHAELADLAESEDFSDVSNYSGIIKNSSNNLSYLGRPWRYPLWQVANQPEYFAYKSGNRADGVCLIERIDLPDGRIVVACIQTAGNPGQSITNCVEELAIQVCERFDIPADKLIWLEHYDQDISDPDEWRLVTFETMPPGGMFENPRWTVVTPDIWSSLRLRPKKRLRTQFLQYESKLRKLFHWPQEAILD